MRPSWLRRATYRQKLIQRCRRCGRKAVSLIPVTTTETRLEPRCRKHKEPS